MNETATAAPPAEPASGGTPAPEGQPQNAPENPFAVGTFAPDPETEPAAAPETESRAPDEKPATEEAPTPSLADLSDDDLANHERVKSLIARQAESERRKAERDATERAAAERRQYTASEQFVRDFEGEILRAAQELDDNGRPQIDRNKVDSMFAGLLSSGADHVVSAVGSILTEDVGKDFKPTDAEADQLEAARLQFARNPLNPAPLFRTWLAMRDRVVLEEARQEAREQGRRDAAEEAARQVEETRARTGREQVREQPGPTPTGPSRTGTKQYDLSTLKGVGEALYAGYEPTADEERQWRERGWL